MPVPADVSDVLEAHPRRWRESRPHAGTGGFGGGAGGAAVLSLRCAVTRAGCRGAPVSVFTVGTLCSQERERRERGTRDSRCR